MLDMMVSDMWMVDASQLTLASTGHCIMGVDAHDCDTTFDTPLLKLVRQSWTLVGPHFKQHLATEVSGEVTVSIRNAGKHLLAGALPWTPLGVLTALPETL